MKRKYVIIIIISCAAIWMSSEVFTIAASTRLTPDASLKKLFPRLQYKSIKKTEIDGFYEVMTGDRIIYFHPKTGYLFIGELINKEGRNITKDRMAEDRYKLISASDLKNAIKIGHGRNVVLEITDPDCPYCRKMHAYWSMRADVTRYVFFKPLDIHPDALKKAKYILASSNREKAMFEVFCGSIDNKREIIDKTYDDKGMLEAQRSVAEKLQVSGTPSYWINGKFVSGANIPLIESIIGKAGNTKRGVSDIENSSCGK